VTTTRRTSEPASLRGTKLTWLWPGLALIALAYVAFFPALGNQYVNYDDGTYIIVNPLLDDVSGLVEIWTGTKSQMYYPLVFTSFWLEKQVGETLGIISTDQPPDPHINHAINILLHGIAAVLLWRCLVRLGMRSGLAWFATAIWVVHPLQVESVVWAVERKNTLAGLFSFAAVLTYLRAGTRMRSGAYVWSILFFVCALLSKTGFLLLWVTLLLLEWLQRRPLRADAVVRALPFFAIGLMFALLTVAGEHQAIIRDIPPFVSRMVIGGLAVWFYLGKLLWPAGMAAIYPRWDPSVTPLTLLPLALACVGGVLWVVYAARKRTYDSAVRATVLIAAAHYVATLAPALGLVPFGYMELSFVANHFLYVPIVGPIVLLAVGLDALRRRIGVGRAAIGGAAALIVLLGGHSFARSLAWKNTITLAEDILRINPNCARAHLVYGLEIEEQARQIEETQPDAAIELRREAVERLRLAVQLRPNDFRTRFGLAGILDKAARRDRASADRYWTEAVEHLRAALRTQPGFHDARWLLARILVKVGDYEAAAEQMELLPASYHRKPEVIDTWARCYSQLGRYDEAFEKARINLQLAPQAERSHELVASVLIRLKRYDEAFEACNDLLALNPRWARAYLLRGQCHLAIGDAQAADQDFQRALTLDPRYAPAVDQLRRSDTSQPTSQSPSP